MLRLLPCAYGTRVLPITEDVAQMFQVIIEDRKAPKVEKSIDGYSGFLFYDDNGMPLVASSVELLHSRDTPVILGRFSMEKRRL